MRDQVFRSRLSRLGASLVVVGLTLAPAACGLDDQEAPALGGPSDLGVSVQLLAQPDTVNADGVSQVLVELILRDQNGAPIGNKAVEFSSSGDGTLFPAAGSTFVGPAQTSLVMATDSAGMAQVVYVAGYAFTVVTISVRPYGIDATNLFFRSVRIQQT